MGGQLLVRVGDPATVLSAVAAEVGATSILAKEELEWVRQHRVQYTKAALQTVR
jgi:deoxyribodipyrimidine photolyase